MKKMIGFVLLLMIWAVWIPAGAVNFPAVQVDYASEVLDGKSFLPPEGGVPATGDASIEDFPVDVPPSPGEPGSGEEARLLDGETLLQPPEEVGWGRDYRFTVENYNQKNDTDAAYVEIPGMIYWSLGETTQNAYTLKIYRENEEEGGEDILIESVDYWNVSEESGYASSFRFLWEQRESGSYYFTIQNRGDEITYRSSEPAQSPVWTYEAPMHKIDAPIRPTWGVRRFATITPVESEYLMGYRAQWFFTRDTQDENAEELAVGNMMQFHPNSVEFRVPDSLLTQYGSGYYAVRICALSDDIRGMSVSDWSTLSRYSAFSAGNRT